MLKLALRTIGFILGLLASAIVLIIDILYSLTNTLVKAGGGSGFQSHFFIGILLVIIGAVGAFLADPLPTASVVLMLIAGIAFFFLVGFWAVIPAIVFLLAILLVFFDRNRAKA
ncbi:MAG TPA: hypothetical protein VFU60_17715 [Ktedonobacterales bacterium]|jgi:hypothetical protein|nr:hypothetical protein [Ktedonobacterales bacterium]